MYFGHDVTVQHVLTEDDIDEHSACKKL